MNRNTQFLLKKAASILCLIVATCLFLSGWVAVRSNKDTKEIKSEMKDFGRELKDMDKEIDELQDRFDDLDVDISAKALYKKMLKLYNMIEDLALSPTEISGLLPVVKSLGKMVEELEDNRMANYVLGYNMRNAIELMQEAKGALILFTFFLVVTIVVGILYVVLHLLNKKGAGYTVIVLQSIWLFATIGVSAFINFVAMDELDIKIVRVTPAPYIALLLVIASCVIWHFAWKDYSSLKTQGSLQETPLNVAALKEKAAGFVAKMPDLKAKAAALGEKAQTPKSFAPDSMTQNWMFCPQCGEKMEQGSAFCTSCGCKLDQIQN